MRFVDRPARLPLSPVFIVMIIVKSICIVAESAHENKLRPDEMTLESLRTWYNSVSYDYSCYSCMDLDIEYHWYKLRNIYIRPANFTDRCADLLAPIGSVACGEQGACVTIVEPQYLAGFRVGESVIRGCSTRIFIDGSIPTGALCTKYKLTKARCSSCRSVSAHAAMPAGAQAVVKSNRPWLLCSCVGLNCNRMPVLPAGQLPQTSSSCRRSFPLFLFPHDSVLSMSLIITGVLFRLCVPINL